MALQFYPEFKSCGIGTIDGGYQNITGQVIYL